MSHFLTRRQMHILRFILGYQEVHGGVSPCVAEMGLALGYSGKTGASGQRSGAVHSALLALEERGLLRRLPRRARAIEVVKPVAIPRAPDGAPLYFVEIGR